MIRADMSECRPVLVVPDVCLVLMSVVVAQKEEQEERLPPSLPRDPFGELGACAQRTQYVGVYTDRLNHKKRKT